MTTLRINLWSGPRNVSTALMYSFAQREDTRVVDEPLYAYYLQRSGADHPGREEVLAAQSQDGEEVVREVILGPCDRPVLFCKQMAHHLPGLRRSFLTQTKNVLLIRNPSEVLLSYSKVVSFMPEVSDTGIDFQSELLDELQELGHPPVVVDSRFLLLDPPGVLSALCQQLGIAFDSAMLSWPAGPRAEDGVWAEHWYGSVHQSTGFAPYRPPVAQLPDRLRDVAEACRPHYEKLTALALRSPG